MPKTLNNPTALYHTFGCKLNFAETSTVASLLEAEGIMRVAEGEVPDYIVVNTCSVTEIADKKCRQAIRSFARRYPHAKIIVTGCYAQLKPEEAASLPGVAVVAGNDRKLRIIDYVRGCESARGVVHHTPTADIREFSPSCSRGDRTRYFLKVQDGCDYYCSYCTIPMARGRSRSGTIDQIVAQAGQVAAEGGREIVITGVNIGDFGKTTGESFLDLIKALDRVEGIARYRISSIEPNLLTDEVLEYCAGSRAFMPHFHIPLQSGCDEVLKLMHRRYTTAFFADKVARVKELMSDAFIGVDVIVGTRGETEDFFEQAYDFIRALDVSQLHVFSYSERPGTMALKISHSVPSEEKHRRSQRLLELSDAKWDAFYRNYIGEEAEVLLEKSRTKGVMHGFTNNYIRVEVPVSEDLDNQIVRVRLGDFNQDRSALCATLL